MTLGLGQVRLYDVSHDNRSDHMMGHMTDLQVVCVSIGSAETDDVVSLDMVMYCMS